MSEFFALNFPTAELLTATHQCGLLSGQAGDKFVATGLTPVDAVALELPLVGECVAHIECGLVGRASFGDHDLFIGEPLAVMALDEAFNGRWLVDPTRGRCYTTCGPTTMPLWRGHTRPSQTTTSASWTATRSYCGCSWRVVTSAARSCLSVTGKPARRQSVVKPCSSSLPSSQV